MIFTKERFTDFKDELQTLAPLHYDKAAVYKAEMPLNLDVAMYESLERLGKLHCMVARVDGEFVGYTVYVVGTALHYQDKLLADCTLWFMTEEGCRHYNGNALVRLINASEEMLRDLKVFKVIHKAKAHTRGHLLFDRAGYDTLETVHGKMLR